MTTNEKTSRRFWLSMIFGFFAIDLTIAIVAIAMAAGDPSFRSIPGFGKRSVEWAERYEQQQNIQKLGLSIDFDLEKSTNETFVVRVKDANGVDVTGLKLRLEAFHFTRVTEQQKFEMLETDEGYVAPLQLSKPGNWHIEIEGQAFERKIWLERSFFWNRKP